MRWLSFPQDPDFVGTTPSFLPLDKGKTSRPDFVGRTVRVDKPAKTVGFYVRLNLSKLSYRKYHLLNGRSPN